MALIFFNIKFLSTILAGPDMVFNINAGFFDLFLKDSKKVLIKPLISFRSCPKSPWSQWPTNKKAKSSSIVSKDWQISEDDCNGNSKYFSMSTPSNKTSIGDVNSNIDTTCLVFSSCFSYLESWNTFLECSDETKFKSILFIPSIHWGAHLVVSIPAVIPILNLPILWNSLGTVTWAQISGWALNCPSNMWGFKKPHSSLWSSINPHGVPPHLCGYILTSYLLRLIKALTKSLLLAE